MSFLRAAARQVLGLFVSDWFQVGIVLMILALGWFAVSRFGRGALVAIVVLLAGQLVWFALAEGRRLSVAEARP